MIASVGVARSEVREATWGEPKRILVVCTANQCRSPMAEGLLAARAAREGLPLDVQSAGTWADEGMPPTDHAVRVMAERGIDIRGIRSTEVTAELVAGSYLILAMTTGHRESLETEFPSAKGKTWLVSELEGGAWDIQDPVGGSLEDYRATADQLERLMNAGWRLLEALVAPDRAAAERPE
jgi:protein-tyrosine-phosphatase